KPAWKTQGSVDVVVVGHPPVHASQQLGQAPIRIARDSPLSRTDTACPFRARCSDGRRVGPGGLSAGGRKHEREHADRARRQPSHRPTAESAAARSISLASDFITKPARTARRAAWLNAEV